MLKKLLLLLLVIISTAIYSSEGLECSVPNVSKTRIFDSVLHYQGNKVPFNPTTGGWEGSNVEFRSPLLKIFKNEFVTYDSESIVSLNLSKKTITEIDDGGFISLVCLRQLFLNDNNITSLTRNTFRDLVSLQVLDLSYNKLEAVEDLVLSNLRKLKVLNLAHNEIKKFGALAFANLSSLEYLNLEGNVLKKFSSDVFRPLDNLTSLFLSWNKFLEVEPEKWEGLNQLHTLDLAGNQLKRFDTSYNFTFTSLRTLNLSSNFLTELNVVGLRRHLPLLEMIDLNNNLWFCDTLEQIENELNYSRIKFRKGVTCGSTTRVSTVNVAPTKKQNEVWFNQSELEQYVEKKIDGNNEQLINTIQSVRGFVIFVFAFLCVFVLFEIVTRTNICGLLVNKCRERNDLYVDDGSDVENFGILRRL